MSSVNLNYSLIKPLQPQYSFPFLPVGAAGVWRRYNDALSWPSHTHTHTQTENHSCNASFPPHSNPWNQDTPRPLFSLHSLSLRAHSRCVELDTAVTTETVLVGLPHVSSASDPPRCRLIVSVLDHVNASSVQIGGVNYCPWFNRVQRGFRATIEICWHIGLLQWRTVSTTARPSNEN